MNIKAMREIVEACTYKPGWVIHFNCGEGAQPRPYIQMEVVNGIDSLTGKQAPWKSGKRYLSQYMCRQEVVGAVFGLIKDAELHEVHEWFRYRGASIYNPHLDPDTLARVAQRRESFNMREDAMSMAELPRRQQRGGE